MKLALNQIGYTQAYVDIPNRLEKYKFLSEFEKVSEDLPQKFKLVIVLDTPTQRRLETKADITNVKKIVIDHHNTEESNFGDLKYVNPEAPATCEILFYMFKKMKIKITKEIATCLYAGILSDTDLLKSRIRTEKTFKAMKKLFNKVNHVEIINELSKVSEREFMQKKNIFKNVQIFKEKDCIISFINKSCLTKEELEGKLDTKLLLRNLQEFDCEMKILIIPTDEGVKLSFRSTSKDILELSNKFGGGGHKTSAGAKLILANKKYFTNDSEEISEATMKALISKIISEI